MKEYLHGRISVSVFDRHCVEWRRDFESAQAVHIFVSDTQRLAAAAASGTVRYGLHRQDAAMMTCFTPSALRSDHVHFIDGARGGYASAATALKATAE